MLWRRPKNSYRVYLKINIHSTTYLIFPLYPNYLMYFFTIYFLYFFAIPFCFFFLSILYINILCQSFLPLILCTLSSNYLFVPDLLACLFYHTYVILFNQKYLFLFYHTHLISFDNAFYYLFFNHAHLLLFGSAIYLFFLTILICCLFLPYLFVFLFTRLTLLPFLKTATGIVFLILNLSIRICYSLFTLPFYYSF